VVGPPPTWINQPAPPPGPFGDFPRPFTLHWGGRTPVRGDESLARAVPLDFGPVPLRGDVVVLRDGDLGRWPREGLEGLIEDPRRLREAVASVPDAAASAMVHAEWDGLVLIDFRGWTPLWERYPPALQERFRRALRRSHPELVNGLSPPQVEGVAREAFDGLVRELYGGALKELRARWPRAKFAYVFVPPMIFGMDPLLPKATMGYGEKWPNPASAMNDRLAWLIEAQDFVVCTVLPWAVSTAKGEKTDLKRGLIDPVLNWQYLSSNLREATRLASRADGGKGKPVLLLSGTRYAQDWGRMTGRPPLSDLDLEQVLTAAVMERNVAGLIVVDEHRTQGEITAWERDLSERIWPALQRVAGRWNVKLVKPEEPLPLWPNSGNLARSGQSLPPPWTPDAARTRFEPVPPR
jgi:hypothetical protein